MKVLLIVPLLICFCMYVKAQCELACPTTLTPRNHVCVGEKSFQLCKVASGQPITTKTYQCPGNTVCTNDPGRCVEGKPICTSSCGVCDPNTHVTCLSKLIYAFCIKGIADPNVNGTCVTGEICVADKPTLCGTAAEKPSCNQDDTYVIPKNGTGTGPGNPTGDPRVFCQQQKIPGRYPAGDTACRDYNYCYPWNGVLTGKLYSCPDKTFFDCKRQTCGNRCNTDCNFQ